ncbi:hypothetical protein [Methylobacterium nigriterrae]|uniref:hypothetical protein n=1 Tax=Methylobacterium nigriterrae TaxID=3127512 RepID=UPI003013D3D4
MTDEVEDLNRARSALVRQRDAITKKLGSIELAPISMAEDLTRVLLAIEAVDRALTDAGHPHFTPAREGRAS